MKLFFRNDDIGWDLKRFQQLLDLFAKHGQKLNGAAIPLTCQEAYEPGALKQYADILEVHSHGLAHLDHAEKGKKSEFGESRNPANVAHDLKQSRAIVEDIFRDLYFPAFTPPWNRMAAQHMPLLKDAGFELLSRDGDKRANIPGLSEVNVDLDLHTSRSRNRLSAEEIMQQVLSAATSTYGVMLHHNQMETQDFDTLERVLDRLSKEGIATHFMSEINSDAATHA